jgi:hypothetical protein
MVGMLADSADMARAALEHEVMSVAHAQPVRSKHLPTTGGVKDLASTINLKRPETRTEPCLRSNPTSWLELCVS